MTRPAPATPAPRFGPFVPPGTAAGVPVLAAVQRAGQTASRLHEALRSLGAPATAHLPATQPATLPATVPEIAPALAALDHAAPVEPARPAAHPARPWNKVFCIGANKTGTSTMEQVFRDLGLDAAPQQEGERAGIEFQRGRFDALRAYVDRHEAFQDAPFSLKNVYAQLDALYPGSRFILTWRPPADWFRSLVGYHARIMGETDARGRPTPEAVRRLDYIEPGYLGRLAETNWLADVDDELRLVPDWSLLYDEDHYTSMYMRRNRDIVRHFAERPQDLLVIDVTREPDTRRIVEFLGLPASMARPMPHMNRT